MSPEFPYIGATLVALVTGVRREGGFPANGIPALIAAAILVIVASATANTRIAPLVRAIGIALLLSALMGFGRTLKNDGGSTLTGLRKTSAATKTSKGATK